MKQRLHHLLLLALLFTLGASLAWALLPNGDNPEPVIVNGITVMDKGAWVADTVENAAVSNIGDSIAITTTGATLQEHRKFHQILAFAKDDSLKLKSTDPEKGFTKISLGGPELNIAEVLAVEGTDTIPVDTYADGVWTAGAGEIYTELIFTFSGKSKLYSLAIGDSELPAFEIVAMDKGVLNVDTVTNAAATQIGDSIAVTTTGAEFDKYRLFQTLVFDDADSLKLTTTKEGKAFGKIKLGSPELHVDKVLGVIDNDTTDVTTNFNAEDTVWTAANNIFFDEVIFTFSEESALMSLAIGDSELPAFEIVAMDEGALVADTITNEAATNIGDSIAVSWNGEAIRNTAGVQQLSFYEGNILGLKSTKAGKGFTKISLNASILNVEKVLAYIDTEGIDVTANFKNGVWTSADDIVYDAVEFTFSGISNINSLTIGSATLPELPQADNIAAFKEANGEAILNLDSAEILYIANDYSYIVQDATGGLVIDSIDIKNAAVGRKLKGSLAGNYSAPMFVSGTQTNDTTIQMGGLGETIYPMSMAEALDEANTCRLVRLYDVTIREIDDKFYAFDEATGDSIAINDNDVRNLHLPLLKDSTKIAILTGITIPVHNANAGEDEPAFTNSIALRSAKDLVEGRLMWIADSNEPALPGFEPDTIDLTMANANLLLAERLANLKAGDVLNVGLAEDISDRIRPSIIIPGFGGSNPGSLTQRIARRKIGIISVLTADDQLVYEVPTTSMLSITSLQPSLGGRTEEIDLRRILELLGSQSQAGYQEIELPITDALVEEVNKNGLKIVIQGVEAEYVTTVEAKYEDTENSIWLGKEFNQVVLGNFNFTDVVAGDTLKTTGENAEMTLMALHKAVAELDDSDDDDDYFHVGARIAREPAIAEQFVAAVPVGFMGSTLTSGEPLTADYADSLRNDLANLAVMDATKVSVHRVYSERGEDIASFKQLHQDITRGDTLTLTDAVVTYINGDDIFVEDASGATTFFRTNIQFYVGQKLNGYIIGKNHEDNYMPRLLKVEGKTTYRTFEVAEEMVTPEAQVISVADASKKENIARFVKLENVILSKDDNGFDILVDEETESSVRIDDHFNVFYDLYEKMASIEGIVGIDKDSVYHFWPTSKEGVVEYIPAPSVALVHTASSSCAADGNAYTSTVDAEMEHVNNEAFSGAAWQGAAYMDFEFTVPENMVVTNATLKFTAIGESRRDRPGIVYCVNAGEAIDYDAMAAGNLKLNLAGAKVADVTFPKGSSKLVELDVTDALKAIQAAGQTHIIFKVTGNPGGGDIYGMGSEDFAPVLDINALDASKLTSYTVNFLNAEGDTLKEATVYSSQLIDEIATASDADMASFKNEDGTKKYIYESGNAEITLDKDAENNVIDLVFREAAQWSYTVNAIDADENVLSVIKSDKNFEGETFTVAMPRCLNIDGTIYTSGTASGKESSTNVTLDADNKVINVTYSATENEKVIFFSEAEDINTLTVTTGQYIQARCSNQAGAFAAEDAAIAELAPGTYVITAASYASKDTKFIFKAGSTEVLTHTGNGGWSEATSEEFTLTEKTTLTVVGGNANYALDYIYIQKIAGSEDDDLIEIPQDQGIGLDTNPRAEFEEGDEFNTYTATEDLTVAFKMLNIDVKDCDYVVVKFAEPIPEGWVIAFWKGLDNVAIPAGSTEYKYVFADDDNCAIENDILPQICVLTLWGAQKPLTVKVTGVYKHRVGTTKINDFAREEMDNAPIFNLRGQKVEGALKPGLYIKNGKKFVIKK